MRDFLQEVSVFGSKMTSDRGQNARQRNSRGDRHQGEQLDFSKMLSIEKMRLAAGRA